MMAPRPILDEMPLHIKQKIYGELDFISRCNFRKSCSANRRVSTNCELFTECLDLQVKDDCIEWKLDQEEFSNVWVIYHEHALGCRIETNIDSLWMDDQIVEGINFLDLALADFGAIIRNKELIADSFRVEVHPEALGLLETIKGLLSSLGHKLHVCVFELRFEGEHEVVESFIPFLKPEILKAIFFWNCGRERNPLDLDRYLEMDQLKSVEVLESSRFRTNARMEKWWHIPHVSLEMRELSADSSRTLITHFVETRSVTYMCLNCEEMDVEEVKRRLDPNFIVDTRYPSVLRYKLSDPYEEMKVTIERYFIQLTKLLIS
ncbi:unnamed protein product [Caenorhabditis sp. 36 PRJEB53466]|nr:unnamed protein product [Caenorhabditis sp. 36 PRJEB53466]